MPRGRLALTSVLGAAGAALLIWQIRDVGADNVAAGLASVGWGFLAILLLAFLRFLARAAAWHALLAEPVRLGRAVAAVIAGDALGKTPLTLLISEPAKALYLGNPSGPGRALAALTAENFFYAISIGIYIALGAVAFLTFDLSQTPMIAALTTLSLVLFGLAFAAWLARAQPSVASGLLAKLPIRRLAVVVDRLRRFERQAYDYAAGQPDRIRRVILALTSFHLLSFLEAWLTVGLLTGESLPLQAFVLDSFSRIINVVFNAIPLRLGVDQYGAKEFATAIGLHETTGFNLSLIRTVRQLVFMVVGVALLAFRSPAGPRVLSKS